MIEKFKKFFIKNTSVLDNTDNSVTPNNKSVTRVLAYQTTKDIREICRIDIENMEHWARRFIHEILLQYGKDYFNYLDENGNRLIKSEIVKALNKRIEAEPQRFPRLVDALFLENIIDILCNDRLYNMHFKTALDYGYPCGKEQIRNSLNKIKDVRNKLSHSNTITIREAEQCICYCHDFVDCLQKYYQMIGKERDYNVPMFYKLTDSQGLTHYFSEDKRIYKTKQQLRSGEIYRIEIEIDPTFNPDSYQISWVIKWSYDQKIVIKNKKIIDVLITNEMVGRYLEISCVLISNKEWHKYGSYDDSFNYTIHTILPPIEDTY